MIPKWVGDGGLEADGNQAVYITKVSLFIIIIKKSGIAVSFRNPVIDSSMS